MKNKIFILISLSVIFTLFFTDKLNILGSIINPSKIIEETSLSPEIYFCSEYDCEDLLINLIKSSNESIRCAFYDLTSYNVIDVLENTKVDMKLVVDKENTEKLKQLNYVDNKNTRQLMHDKFCVFDGKIVLTGSFNPTERAFQNDNNVIIIYSRYLAKNYESEFEELWNGEFGSGKSVEYPVIYFNGKITENYFCPEDSCSKNIIKKLNSARNSIYFMAFTFTHQEIADTLITKQKEGIEVKGVTEKFQSNTWTQYHRLKDNGIDVKWDSNPYMMHHKVFIIDNKTVITGSFNPTKSADEENDENVLIIQDENIAREYLKEFDRVFGEA